MSTITVTTKRGDTYLGNDNHFTTPGHTVAPSCVQMDIAYALMNGDNGSLRQVKVGDRIVSDYNGHPAIQALAAAVIDRTSATLGVKKNSKYPAKA